MPGFTTVPRATYTLVLGGALVPQLLDAAPAGRRTASIVAGAESTLGVTLQPGRYEVYCPVGNGAHKQAGMKATITVTAESAAPSLQY